MKMNKKKIIGVVVALALLALVVFQLADNKQTTESRVYQYDKEKPILVETDTIRLKKLSESSNLTGVFVANRETRLSAETQGKVNRVYVDIGSVVKKGQKIIQLDNSLLKLQLDAAKVKIEELEADVERYTVLADADAIQAVKLEKTMLGLRSAKIQKATLEKQIEKTSIIAPFSGVVTAKLTEVGAFAAPGIPLIQITDLDSLRFTINVSEQSLAKFKENEEVEIRVDLFPNIELTGIVTMIGSKANMGNNFPVQVKVSNTKQREIKAGMFGKINLTGSDSETGIIIPSAAIIQNANNTNVYVVDSGKAKLQSIKTLRSIDNNTIVANGLNEGDIIVTSGFINLFDGANIVIKKK